MDNILLIVAYLLVGSAAGFAGGLLGVGGGILVVPALILIFEITGLFDGSSLAPNFVVLFATGTSMGVMVFTTASSAFAQWRRKNIQWKIVRIWMPLLVLGAFSATYVAKLLPVHLLKALIGVFLFFVAVVLILDNLPTSKREQPKTTTAVSAASAIGLLSGLVGISGGVVIVPSLLYFNVVITKAAAVASTCGFGVSVAGAIGYFFNGAGVDFPNAIGFIYLPAVISIAITSVLFAPIGVHVAQQLPAAVLRKIFGGLMCVVATSMFYSIFI